MRFSLRLCAEFIGAAMAIIVNGKDMKDAVIKTEQFEMRILELTPDRLKVSVMDTQRESFNFVPRFISMVYPDRTINARDAGPVAVRSKETVEVIVLFREKLRMETFMPFELRYAGKKLAEISIE
jgi:hypothetical protein